MHRSACAFTAIAFVLIGGGVWAAPAGKPEDLVRAYFAALQQKGMAGAVELWHPDALARFRDMMLPFLVAEDAAGKRDLRASIFGAGATLRDAKAASPSEFMAGFMKIVSAQLGDVRFEKIEVLGSVPEGEVVHVLTRVQVGYGEAAMRRMQVYSVKLAGDVWKLMLTGEMEGFARMMKGRVRR